MTKQHSALRRFLLRSALGVGLAAAWGALPQIEVGPAKAGHYVRTDSPDAGHYVGPRFGVVYAQQEEPTSPRANTPLTFLQINDVYSTVPVDGLGGLARVATLKKQLTAAGKTPFLVIAGDFISPSVPSTIFKGEQMVAALNATGLDLATLGNHEFDFGTDVLLQRMSEAKWTWVVSNIIDTNTDKPIGGALPYLVKTFGTLKVGFIGLCLTSEEIVAANMQHVRLVDPFVAAATYLPQIKNEGANVIVAVTHLSFDEDRELARRFPEIDLIIGGHEHFPITATVNRTFISKAGADAKYVARIDVNRSAEAAATGGGTAAGGAAAGGAATATGAPEMVERYFELMPITSAFADDPATLAVVNAYESRLSTELNVEIGSTRVALDAVSVRLRGGETGLGNLVADAMRAEVGADIAIVNAGGIRGDRLYPAGPITKRTVVGIHPFGNIVCKIAVPGRAVVSALNNGVARLPASEGRFPQVSGLTMKVDATAPAGSRVSDVMVNGEPIDLDRIYTVATTDYQLQGGDGYSMFAEGRVLVGPESGPVAASVLERYITARGEVNPAVEGRIVISR